jgi:hypothetical protein
MAAQHGKAPVLSTCQRIQLESWSPGTARHLGVYRFGVAGAGPKVYIQAGIHADELPANLVAHHLKGLLEDADRAGRIRGEIVLVPVANPLGFANVVMNKHMGRYHAASGQNFNRGWPNVAAEAVAAMAAGAGKDAQANAKALRAAIAAALAGRSVTTEAQMLQLTLMGLAADADMVLDLHTDSEAELHLYVDPDQWPAAADLAALLEAPVVMFARDSGDDPFEETVAQPFIVARARGIAVALPLTAVVELRGAGDVSHELASKDAAALMAFLTHRGIIAGDRVVVPAFSGIAAPFAATQVLRAPAGGLLVYRKKLGAMVKPGDIVAEVIDPSAPPGAPAAPVMAETEGRFFARVANHLAQPGAAFGKIHGTTPLKDRTGKLLYD